MAELTLEVSRREDSGKGFARKLRQAGKVPAIVYGGHKESVSISVDRKTVTELVQKSEHGIRSVFLLKVADSDQNPHAMIKDIQMDPISRTMKHIDFVRVVMDEVLRVTVPVHAIGTPIGVKIGGGILDFALRELHIECLPNAIPDSIDVDVSKLDLHAAIHVSDLEIPSGVKVLDAPELLILTIATPRVEEVAPEVAAVAEPEVAAKKGKAEEEKK